MRGIKYCPGTGNIYRNNPTRGTQPGPIRGKKTADGYLKCMIAGVTRFHHRVAIEIMTKEPIPDGKLTDHLDGNRTNNKWSNLRIVSNRENQVNQVAHRNGKLPGFTLVRSTNRFRSRIRIDNKNKHLGYFATELEAHQAYLNALKNIDKRPQ